MDDGHSSHGIEDQGLTRMLGVELESQFETRSVRPRSSIVGGFLAQTVSVESPRDDVSHICTKWIAF